jgi:prepilin-type N-terminal cleavage/methylation domain-containing protein
MTIRSRHRGFTLVELLAAAAMVGVVLAVMVPVIGWAAAERRAVARRERAMLEAANVLERLAERPWDRITNEDLKRVQLSESASAALPGASLRVEVAEIAGPPEAKRVRVAIRWRDRPGVDAAPVRLSAFVHRRGVGP